MWNHDLIVGEDDHANISLQIAETLGLVQRRKSITREQFAPILALYEPYRDKIEGKLCDFDEENQSWRDYAGYAFDFVSTSVSEKVNELIKSLTKGGATSSTRTTPFTDDDSKKVRSPYEAFVIVYEKATQLVNTLKQMINNQNVDPDSPAYQKACADVYEAMPETAQEDLAALALRSPLSDRQMPRGVGCVESLGKWGLVACDLVIGGDYSYQAINRLGYHVWLNGKARITAKRQMNSSAGYRMWLNGNPQPSSEQS